MVEWRISRNFGERLDEKGNFEKIILLYWWWLDTT
jgi:hypothetical protein